MDVLPNAVLQCPVMSSPDWSCWEYESLYVQATHHHIHAFVKRPKHVLLWNRREHGIRRQVMHQGDGIVFEKYTPTPFHSPLQFNSLDQSSSKETKNNWGWTHTHLEPCSLQRAAHRCWIPSCPACPTFALWRNLACPVTHTHAHTHTSWASVLQARRDDSTRL